MLAARLVFVRTACVRVRALHLLSWFFWIGLNNLLTGVCLVRSWSSVCCTTAVWVCLV
jgi:hypothetical protein